MVDLFIYIYIYSVNYFRYKGFNEPPWVDNKYEYTAEYWHVVAAQFIFIFIFEVSD